MRDIQKLDVLLMELGVRYNISNLKMPSHGAVGLRLKDGSELYLEHDDAQGKLYAYMAVMDLPKDDAARLDLLTRMLQLNFLGSGVEHGVLSIEREMAICQTSFIVNGLQFDTFDRALQNLIACRSGLAAKLKTGKTSRAPKMRHSASTLLAALKQEVD